MAEYITEQKLILKKILEDNRDRAYTVEELMEKMKASCPEGTPARSTVYRLITHLTEEGSVKKFFPKNSRKAAYQIVGGEHCDSHLHLKCTGCGKLFHLDEGISDELLDKVRNTSGFCVSEEETVLFGKCGNCRYVKQELYNNEENL